MPLFLDIPMLKTFQLQGARSLTPWQRGLPLNPAGGSIPRPCYRLELRACHVSPTYGALAGFTPLPRWKTIFPYNLVSCNYYIGSFVFVELSDSSADSSVILVSDSDKSEDELECALSEKHQQHCDRDQYAAAVAAAFLNTSTKTARLCHSEHDSSASEEHEAVFSISDGSVNKTVSDDLNGVTSSVTCTERPSDDLVLQPTQTDLQMVSSTTKTIYNDFIAPALAGGLDSSELSDCLNPIDLLSADKNALLSDVCNSSFLGDLSFINECLVEDCDASNLLDYSGEPGDALPYIQKVDTDNESKQFASEVLGSDDITSCVLAAVASSSDAADDDAVNTDTWQSNACFQQFSVSYSQINTANGSCMLMPVDCEQGSHNTTLHQRTVSVSINISQPANQLTSQPDQAVSRPCQFPASNFVGRKKSTSVHVDMNANEHELMSAADAGEVKVECDNVQDNCHALDMDTCGDDNLLSAGTHKRLLPEEFSYPVSKIMRSSPDCVSEEWLTSSDASMHDTTVLSLPHSNSSVYSDEGLSELHNVCCACCNLPCAVSSLAYCTDGHVCCSTCLQQQVKRLLSAPSKV